MRLQRNVKLMAEHRAENFQDYADAWLDSASDMEPAQYQVAYLEDMFPDCRLVGIEASIPLPGMTADYEVRAHMEAPNGVFTVVGRGQSYPAALYGCVLDGTRTIRDFLLRQEKTS